MIGFLICDFDSPQSVILSIGNLKSKIENALNSIVAISDWLSRMRDHDRGEYINQLT